MYTIYDHVDIIHLDEKYLEPVFGNIGLHAQFDEPDFDNVTASFAKREVYALDRERYIQFMDHDTMIERIDGSGKNYIIDFFRMRSRGGEYAWKMVGLIHITDKPGNLVMYCIRSTHWAHNGLLQAAFDSTGENRYSDLSDADYTMTDGSLWRALMHDKSISLFWKDRDRRFVGANQAFLDYYGFDSVAEILGKTDEDMGWHIDPTPFMNDELRILKSGAHVENAAGTCIVNGEVRNIVANKRPVYRNGHIVGLVGYFVDVDDDDAEDAGKGGLPVHDKVTGVLNYTGLEAATWQFVDSYKRKGVDFAMVSVNVESFQAINDTFGYAFGEKVLKRTADELRAIAGNRRVIGHVYAERFVILTQVDSDEELQELCKSIEQRLLSIPRIDGTPCTIYAMAGYARFSELGDVEAMKRHNRDNRQKRRERWSGTSGSSDNADIITSSLL